MTALHDRENSLPSPVGIGGEPVRTQRGIRLNSRLASLFLSLGLAAGVLLFPSPAGMTPPAQRLAAVTVFMAVAWVTQPIPIAVTSLIPLAAYPLLGIVPAKEVSLAYADGNVFLFLGGFLIALAIERWNLHRRIALHVVSRSGGSPRRIVIGFMATTALLSMWISNTAATMLMLPIALALVTTLREALARTSSESAAEAAETMTVPLLIGIAYASSCGGFASLIGTPTNVSLRGFWERTFVPQGYPNLSFAEWMIVFVPAAAAMLGCTAGIMLWKCPPLPGGETLTRGFFRERLNELGPATPAERRVFVLFAVTALLWILRQPLVVGETTLLPGWPDLVISACRFVVDATFLREFLHDSTIAIAMACLLFLIPGDGDASGKTPTLLSWDEAERGVPWGMLLLIGGGFAMADAFAKTGLSAWLGTRFADLLQGQPVVVLVIGVCVLLTFLTEFTTNVATVNTLLPTLAAMAVDLEIDPRLLLIPATVSASCAFMLPVATPPNAIVFATGRVPMIAMIRLGLLLNLIGVAVVTLTMMTLGVTVMGIATSP